MANDMDLGINLGIKDKMTPQLNRAKDSMSRFVKGAQEGIAGANRFQKSLGPMATSAARAGGELKRLAAQLIGFAALAKIGKEIFDTNVEFERLSGALKVAMGSAEAGTAKFNELEKFAATTPYSLQEAVQGFITLKNLGLDPTNRSLASFGNTASSMGKPLQQMIEAVADASTMEFERLKEFGIKAKQEGNKVKFTFQGVTTAVKKDAKSIQEYLIGLGETKFAGAMTEQMGRLPGVISNFGDSIAGFFRKMGSAGFTKGIMKVIEALGLGTEASDDMAEALGKLIGQGLEKLADVIKSVRQTLGGFVDSVGGAENALRYAAAAGAVFLGVMAFSKISGMISGFLQMAKAVRLVGIMGLFADGAIAAIPLLLIAIGTMIGFVAGYAAARWLEIKQSFLDAVDVVVKPWWEAFKAFFEFLKVGFMESADLAIRLMNPLNAPGAIKDLVSGKAYEKSGMAFDQWMKKERAAAATGNPAMMPFNLASEFTKNMTPTLASDFAMAMRDIKKYNFLPQVPEVPPEPSMDSLGPIRGGKGGFNAPSLAAMKNVGMGQAPIKVQNTVNIPKTTITPAPVNIDKKKIAEIVFEVMQTQTVRN